MRSMSENDAKIVSAKGKQCSEILEAPAPGENSEEIFPESFWLLFLVVRSVGASRCFHALGTHADSVPIFNEVFIAHPEHPIVRIPISPPGTNARELCPQLRILLPFRPPGRSVIIIITIRTVIIIIIIMIRTVHGERVNFTRFAVGCFETKFCKY